MISKAQLELGLLLVEIARLREMIERLRACGKPIPFKADQELLTIEGLVNALAKAATVH